MRRGSALVGMSVGGGPGIPEAQPVTVGGGEVEGVRELVSWRGDQGVTPGGNVPRAGYCKIETKYGIKTEQIDMLFNELILQESIYFCQFKNMYVYTR